MSRQFPTRGWFVLLLLKPINILQPIFFTSPAIPFFLITVFLEHHCQDAPEHGAIPGPQGPQCHLWQVRNIGIDKKFELRIKFSICVYCTCNFFYPVMNGKLRVNNLAGWMCNLFMSQALLIRALCPVSSGQQNHHGWHPQRETQRNSAGVEGTSIPLQEGGGG